MLEENKDRKRERNTGKVGVFLEEVQELEGNTQKTTLERKSLIYESNPMNVVNELLMNNH